MIDSFGMKSMVEDPFSPTTHVQKQDEGPEDVIDEDEEDDEEETDSDDSEYEEENSKILMPSQTFLREFS